MINATLCSANESEPWAANVNFDVASSIWTTKLNADYAHYKNLKNNGHALIVLKSPAFEIIMKGDAELSEIDTKNLALATIKTKWLRLVEDGVVQDFESSADIERILSSKQLH